MDFFITSLPQCLINGLYRGSIYALIAIGFTIIYNATDIINFAQGEFAMLGGLIAITLSVNLHLPLWLAVPGAVAAVTVIGALFEAATIHPLKSPSPINLIIITIGGSIFFKGAAMKIWGKDSLRLEAFSGTEPIHLWLPRVGGFNMAPQSLWVLGATLVAVAALHEFYKRTITGKALRACAHSPGASSLVGINVRGMVLYTFALSGGLGALAGVVVSPLIFSNYQVGTLIGLKGFCAAILGGMGSIYGAVIGGLLIGILESLFGTHVSSGYMDAFAFMVMLLVLFVRPSGLLGEASADRA